MSKVLLQEYFELCPEGRCPVDTLTESEKRSVMNEGAVYLVGVCQRAGTKNGNGRIYRKDTLAREVENYQKAIDSYIETHKIYPAMETPLMMIERLKIKIKKESI